MVKKAVKSKKTAKTKTKTKAIKKSKAPVKKKTVKLAKVETKKICDVCSAKGPLSPVFSYDVCLDCYLLLEPYFNNLVQEMKNDSEKTV